MRYFAVSVTSGPPGTPWRVILPCEASPHISASDGLLDVLATAEDCREAGRYALGPVMPAGRLRESHGLAIEVSFRSDTGTRRSPDIPARIEAALRAKAPSNLHYSTQTGACLVFLFDRAVTDDALAGQAAIGAQRLVSQFLEESDLHLAEYTPGRFRGGLVVDEGASGAGEVHFLPRAIVNGSKWGGGVYTVARVPLFDAGHLARLAEALPAPPRFEFVKPRPTIGRTISRFFGALAGKEA